MIKNKKTTILLFFIPLFSLFSQNKLKYHDFSLKKSKKTAFLIGEKIKYRFSYGKSNKKGILTAGYGQFEVKKIVNLRGSDCYYIKASGSSTKLFSIFYEVNDVFESYLDTSEFVPLKFYRNIHEDKYKAKQLASFIRGANYVKTVNLINQEKKHKKISKYTQDVLSALFASRNIANENINLNDTVFIEIFNLEKTKITPSYFVPIKKETIKTKIGTLKTIKCKINTKKSRIFSDKNSTYIWVTDDQKHLPVKLETPIRVGSIYIEILSVENLFEN